MGTAWTKIRKKDKNKQLSQDQTQNQGKNKGITKEDDAICVELKDIDKTKIQHDVQAQQPEQQVHDVEQPILANHSSIYPEQNDDIKHNKTNNFYNQDSFQVKKFKTKKYPTNKLSLKQTRRQYEYIVKQQDKLQQASQILEIGIDELQNDTDEMQTNIEELQQSTLKLQKETKQMQNEIRKLQQSRKIIGKQKQIVKQRRIQQNLNKIILQLKYLEKLEAEEEALEQHYREIEAQHEQMAKEQAQQLENQIQDLQSTIYDLDKEMEEYQKQIDDVENEIEQFRQMDINTESQKEDNYKLQEIASQQKDNDENNDIKSIYSEKNEHQYIESNQQPSHIHDLDLNSLITDLDNVNKLVEETKNQQLNENEKNDVYLMVSDLEQIENQEVENQYSQFEYDYTSYYTYSQISDEYSNQSLGEVNLQQQPLKDTEKDLKNNDIEQQQIKNENKDEYQSQDEHKQNIQIEIQDISLQNDKTEKETSKQEYSQSQNQLQSEKQNDKKNQKDEYPSTIHLDDQVNAEATIPTQKNTQQQYTSKHDSDDQELQSNLNEKIEDQNDQEEDNKLQEDKQQIPEYVEKSLDVKKETGKTN